MAKKIQLPETDRLALINSYNDGESVLQISKRFGFSRPFIGRILLEAGVSLRNRSEAEYLKWSKLKRNPSAIQRQLKAAWEASRRVKDREQASVLRAKSNYLKKYHVHYGEDAVGSAIEKEGFDVEYQYPAGRYSIDVAIPALKIAVEVVASNWHPKDAGHLNRRTEYLLSQGWLVVFTLIWRKEFGLHRPRNADNTFARPVRVQPYFDPPRIARYVAQLALLVREDKKRQGAFDIISGNGLSIRVPSGYLDGLPPVPYIHVLK